MASISEQLKYIMSLDASQAIKSFEKVGQTADKELSKADAKLDKLGGNLTKVGAGAVAFAGVAGAGLVKVALGASDLAESVNAVNVTFGDAAEGILKLGEEAATAVGLSKSEFNGLAVQFSSFAEVIAGEGGDVVGTMDEMTTRVADFASVMNLDVPEAARIFQSALAGETEPIKKFGIDLSAASVALHAVDIGLIKTGDSMTAAQKTQATYSLLMQSTAKTAGDFANTSDGLANQQRILKAELQNLSDGIGTGVLPMLTAVVTTAGKVTHAFASMSPETQGLIGKFAAIGVAGIGMLGTLSLIAGQVIKMRGRFTELGTDGVRSLNNMGKAAKGLGVAFGIATVAVIAWELNTQRQNKSMKQSIELTEELGRVSEKELGQTFTEAVVAAGLAGKSLEDTMAGLAEANLEGALRVRDNAEALGISAEWHDALNDAINTEIVARETQIAVTEEYTAVEGEAAEATDVAASATKSLKEEMEGGISTTDVAVQSAEALAAQHENTAEAAEAQAEALAELTAEMIDAISSTFNLEKATLNLESSYAAYQEAVLATTETLQDSEVTDREKEQALRDLRTQEIGLAEEALATAEAYAQEKGAADGSAESARLQRLKLQELQRQFPELRDEIQQYINKLNAIPLNITTTVSTDSRGLRQYASGTTSVPGHPGQPQLAIVHGGEEIRTANQVSADRSADNTRMGGGNTYVLQSLVAPNEAQLKTFGDWIEAHERRQRGMR